jgi:hypothetical protein
MLKSLLIERQTQIVFVLACKVDCAKGVQLAALMPGLWQVGLVTYPHALLRQSVSRKQPHTVRLLCCRFTWSGSTRCTHITDQTLGKGCSVHALDHKPYRASKHSPDLT